MNYDYNKGLSFSNYCDMSIKNKIKNLLRDNKSYFYNVQFEDQETIETMEYNYNSKYNHLDNSLMELNEEVDPYLSEYERKIYNLYKIGITSRDISEVTNSSIRSVYNAIQRINRKRKEINRNKTRLQFTKQEAYEYIKEYDLSKMENDVYLLYLLGNKSCDIANKLDLKISQVYDAIRRVNKKISKKNKIL